MIKLNVESMAIARKALQQYNSRMQKSIERVLHSVERAPKGKTAFTYSQITGMVDALLEAYLREGVEQ